MNDVVFSRGPDIASKRRRPATPAVDCDTDVADAAQRRTACHALPAPAAEPDAAGELADKQRRKEQVRLLADSFPGAVAYINGDGRHAFGNSTYERWFNNHGGVEGVSMAVVFGAAAYARLRPHVAAALAGRNVTFETRLPLAAAGHRDMRVSYVPQFGEDGTVIGFFALIDDCVKSSCTVSADPRAHTELFYAHRVATMADMVTGLAHDLNQPLGAIASYVGGLKRMLNAEVERDEAVSILHKIAEQAKCASDIVGHVREFIDRDTNRHALVDVNRLLRKSVSLTEGRARQIGADVHLHLAPRLCPVCGDAVQLEQVLINLITNALEAMESTARGARKLTLHSISHGIGHVEITVCDTGEGIPSNRLGRIFEAFHTTKQDGMGVGLSISRAIAKAHGGRLWAESRAGRGACFHLRLPAAKPDAVDDVA